MMKKILSFVLLSLLITQSPAISDISSIIKGHIADVKNRFKDDQIISGIILKQGAIDKSAKGQDLIHNSSGTWSLLRVDNDLYLQSSKDFSSSPGPDYHVYVSSAAAIQDNEEFDDKQIEVGKLLKPNGAAYYKLPIQDSNQIHSVLIWCKQFKEYIGSANLIALR